MYFQFNFYLDPDLSQLCNISLVNKIPWLNVLPSHLAGSEIESSTLYSRAFPRFSMFSVNFQTRLLTFDLRGGALRARSATGLERGPDNSAVRAAARVGAVSTNCSLAGHPHVWYCNILLSSAYLVCLDIMHRTAR